MRLLSLFPALLFALALPAGAQRLKPGTPPARTPDGHSMVIVVNIPASVLTLYQDETAVLSYPVSPGRVKYETPTGTYQIHSVIWNPDWRPPNSAWADNREYTPPGPRSLMGRVKLPFDQDEALYIHGSPASEANAIGRPASHGCIRLKNADAIELGRRIMSVMSPGVSSERIDSVLNAHTPRTTVMKLVTPVQVRVIYAIAQVVGDSLWVYPDPYGATRVTDTRARIGSGKPRAHVPTRTDEALLTLRSAGVPEAAIDSAGIAAAVEASRGRTVKLPIKGPIGTPHEGAASRRTPGESAPIRSVQQLLKEPYPD